jgi:galactoside O-acetyltransferase
LEDFTGLSSGVRIFTGSESYSGEWLTNPTIPKEYRGPVRSFVLIKKHAVIGANTVILAGVTIGEGAAIGANSLITRDIQPWSINAGSPARILRQRSKERILELEEKLRANSHI